MNQIRLILIIFLTHTNIFSYQIIIRYHIIVDRVLLSKNIYITRKYVTKLQMRGSNTEKNTQNTNTHLRARGEHIHEFIFK